MAVKTFSVDEAIYAQFAKVCKERGIIMSKQIEQFMAYFVAEEPKVKKAYLDKLEKIRKGDFVAVDNFAKHFGIE